MEVTFFHKNLTKSDEAILVEYVGQKTEAIAKILTKFAPDAKLLRITTQKFEKHDAYQVEFCLSLPNKSIVAKEASHQLYRAVDLSKDRLVTQIKKHMAQLRKSRSHQSIRDNHEVPKLELSMDIG
ncbi:HPF/RaiA family ribosome-associated protein [Candidatus Gracilibacteria bacterium]|nr:HPF/RaiA family ribosome-associated protein [Candidatus Gracilibacteria bacterium]